MKNYKKDSPLTGTGRNPDIQMTVQKSMPLLSLWRTDLTLAEFKILDSYLARIDSHKPERRAVVLEKGELEKLLGVKRIDKQVLELRLRHLMGNVIEVKDNDVKRGFRLVTLFEEAEAEQDDFGVWKIKLECTQKAMKYFFNVESFGYLKYKLRCVTSMTSRYAYVMYIYLEKNRYRKTWEVDLDELKTTLCCDEEDTYKEFKFFNTKILKRVQAELHKKTECRFSYEPVKRGRKVTAIRFTVATKDYEQISFDEYPDELPEDDSESQYSFYAEACENTFSDAEMALIVDALTEVIPFDTAPNLDLRRYDFLRVKYHELIIREQDQKQKPITNRCKYLVKMITKAE